MRLTIYNKLWTLDALVIARPLHSMSPFYFMKSKKRDTSIARNIWKSTFGEIPKDELGRSYEIHHIDSNPENNSIENLSCISIEDHYKTHIERGEIAAALLIAQRIDLLEKPKQKTKWVYKNNKEMLVSLDRIDDYINSGWTLGMISTKGKNNPMHKSNGVKPPSLNKIWINNKVIDILIDKRKEQEYIYENSEWIRGRLRIAGDRNAKSFTGRFGILHPRSKNVCKIDISTHKIIQVYNGVREAMRNTNQKHPGNISSSCKTYEKYENGELKNPKICYGYYWKYEKL